MNTRLEVLQDGMVRMHKMVNRVVRDMSAEQLNYRPPQGGVSPFFSLWHYVRTEDNVFNYIAQGRETVWLAGGYDQKLTLPRTSQGTAMTAEQAAAIQIADLETWNEYQRKVWAASDEFLQRVDPGEFDTRTLHVKPVPPMTLWNALWGLGLTHGYRHVGEIEYARGVQGLPGLF